MLFLFFLCLSFILTPVSMLHASDTMLMFVGEDLEVLTLGSRREEAAWSAPAIAHVITREAIEKAPAATLADLLGDSAGFYINERERGSVAYLRGIPDSALLLYDTVPMGSAAARPFHGIDNETSLAAVKRVEIVRGAGSVLWGPDAFAGVVNVVPLSGRSFQGVETGAGYSPENDGGWAYVNAGTDQGAWNGFLSVSAKKIQEDDTPFHIVRFWNDDITPAPAEERLGAESPGDSHYCEVYTSISLDDWLTLSARLTDNQNTYTVAGGDGESVWEETLSSPARTLKIEASKATGMDSGIRFTGYYSENDTTLDIIDKAFTPSEKSIYGEFIYDRSLSAGNGLLTSGASWRQNTFRDLVIWKSFFPDYLTTDNTWLLPLFETADYENTLVSFFGQYRHRFSDLELWAGLRNDSHDLFEDKLSYNLGLAWDFRPDFIFKAAYGTAYRTPSADQVLEGITSHLEQINSINTQLAWKSGTGKRVALTFFHNDIDQHVVADRYSGAGLSIPNTQTLLGAELEWDIRVSEKLSFSGNLTRLHNHGTDETYNYGRYFYEDAAGGIQEGFFQTLNYPYDAGADTLATFSLNWRLSHNFTLMPKLRYIADTKLHYLQESVPGDPVQEITVTAPDVWLMDIHLKMENLIPFSVDFFIENVWDKSYLTPGRYTLIPGDGFRAGAMVKMKW